MKRILLCTIVLAYYALPSQSQVPNYVPTADLVGWYSFSGNANDASVNGNDGIATQSVTYGTDRFGNPNSMLDFGFDVNKTVTVSSPSGVSGNAKTISQWIKMPSTIPAGAYYNQIVRVHGTQSSTGTNISTLVYGPYSTYITDGIVGKLGLGASVNASNDVVADDGWHHCVHVLDGDVDSLFMYVDGNPSGSFEIPQMNYDEWLDYTIGVNPGFGVPSQTAFSGQIDDIGIWNRALSEQEVTDIYTENVTVGIDENSDADAFKVYPNPTEGLVNIYTNDIVGLVTYRILDTKGSLVATGSFTAYQNQQEAVDLSAMPTGIYAIQMQSGDAVFNQKLVRR